MNNVTRSILLAAALLTGASATMAAPQMVPDKSDQYGGYSHNSTQGQRQFWENQQNNGD
jgi:hypothetical protein